MNMKCLDRRGWEIEQGDRIKVRAEGLIGTITRIEHGVEYGELKLKPVQSSANYVG